MTEFLTQALGGPNSYSRSREWPSLREAHARFRIGEAEGHAWLGQMLLALDDVVVEESIRLRLRTFFETASAHLVNRTGAEIPIAHHDEHVDRLAERWSIEVALDEVGSAVRAGDEDRVLTLVETSGIRTLFSTDEAGAALLLGQLCGPRQAKLNRWVLQKLTERPELRHSLHARGRTLLHDAAGAGNAEIVDFLASPEPSRSGAARPMPAQDTTPLDFSPLHTAANENGTPEIVRMLVQAGANVDAQGGVKRVTALHNAARRGNALVAEALIDCGANLEIQDSNGETPLRRAVNCSKPAVVALLVTCGANVHARGSRGLTPIEATRNAKIIRLLRGVSPA